MCFLNLKYTIGKEVHMNNKGKIILVVFIGIIALVAIIGAAVLVNDIPSKMSVNGSYISTSEFASSEGKSSTTLKFNALKGTFQQISDSGNIIQEGKYEVYDNIIKLSGAQKTSNSLDYETMYVDGDVIYYGFAVSKEEIPDGDTFDATATFDLGVATISFEFKSDGTYEDVITQTKSQVSSSYGTYTREGDYVCLTSFDEALNFKFYISNNKLIYKSYVKQ